MTNEREQAATADADATVAAQAAFEAARAVVRREPDNAPAIRRMAAASRAIGDEDTAAQADFAGLRASLRSAELRGATAAVAENRLAEAEALLDKRLATDPDDAAALRVKSGIAARCGRLAEAEALLRRAIALVPSFEGARMELAILLHKTDRLDAAIAEVEALLAVAPESGAALGLKAVLLARTGRAEEAVAASAAALARNDREPRSWLSHARWLRQAGLDEEAVAAIRRALALAPALGDAWWSLADLKTVRLSDQDVAAMHAALAERPAKGRDAMLLHFALGKAEEDRVAPAAAFAHYAEGNRQRRATLRYDADALSRFVAASERVLTADMFAEREGRGHDSRAPIFVLGMHRAGSTLVEQILASHSEVEGVAELPNIKRLAERVGGEAPLIGQEWPEALAQVPADELEAMGGAYLSGTAPHRRTGRPRFVDKMPGNWRFAGLIHLILPQATIIDVRRHPLDCCLSNFRQFFADGQDYSYDLGELGRHYADYVRLMRHWDAVLPGRVVRVIYEDLVTDTEAEVRRLLAACGLPFEESCLRFHENDRAVRTPSAGQVRQPVNRKGIDRWQPFAPWLGPLKEGLGPALETWRD